MSGCKKSIYIGPWLDGANTSDILNELRPDQVEWITPAERHPVHKQRAVYLLAGSSVPQLGEFIKPANCFFYLRGCQPYACRPLADVVGWLPIPADQ